MPTSLVQRVADELRPLLADADAMRLPSMAVLARNLGVSRTIILRAVHLLRDEGLVAVARGSRIRAASKVPAVRLQHGTSAERVRDALAARITSGSLRAGDQLPVAKSLIRELRISATTLRATLLLLHADGLVCKKGKAWLVGSQEPRTLAAGATYPLEILVLHRNTVSWHRLGSSRTAEFYNTFTRHAERRGVRLTTVFADEHVGRGYRLPGGLHEIARHIADLGPRCLGTLVPLGSAEFPRLPTYLEALLRLDKPVVWFDRYDEPDPPCPASRRFFRCHFDERAAVRAALEYLYDAGHRTVLYAHNDNAPWMRARGVMFEETARGAFPAMRLIHHVSPFAMVVESPNENFRLEVRRHYAEGAPWNVALIESHLDGRAPTPANLDEAASRMSRTRYAPWFFSWHPVVGPALLDRRVTVLVAPSEKHGKIYWEWLHAAGVRLPRDISMIGFDHSTDAHPFPLTTVDFGLGSLGYHAWQVFMGETPVPHDRRGNVAPQPFVVDRGSVRVVR